MKLSVIIPFHNAASTLGLQLDALARQQWSQPWEIILADNGSKDNSREVIESYREKLPNIRIVDASERPGAAFARNMGIKAAQGEVMALCDADDEVGDGWLAAMGEALSRHDFVACRMEMEKLNPEWMWGHEQEHGLQMIWYPPWLPHAGAGTMGFSKTMFEEVGGFDDTLLHLEDTEFSFRAQMMGHPLHFVPDAVLHVRRRGNLIGNYRQSRNYAEYNVILAKKYWTKNDSSLGFYKRFVIDCLSLVLEAKSLRTEGGRFYWMWKLGRQAGRLKGMLLRGGVPV
ncbi:MAG: glycosyltransferase family A protein [Luteolibacter sp.]|jgi:glycosyltransferase involved in cell wall biosynthesis|nr:glycosyltransferase family A protein [Luteolibacter sp.]